MERYNTTVASAENQNNVCNALKKYHIQRVKIHTHIVTSSRTSHSGVLLTMVSGEQAGDMVENPSFQLWWAMCSKCSSTVFNFVVLVCHLAEKV